MAAAQDHRDPQLFAQCRLCIVCSASLDAELASQVSAKINEHGGESVIHKSPAPISPENEFSHVVSSTIDFAGHDAVCNALVPVVKPQWVWTSISKNKLANPRQFNPDPRLFMNNVVVSCADIPEGDKDAIVGGVLAMGGLYSPRVTSSTTHLVALDMRADKCQAVTSRGLNIKIILPHWFDDCLKLGKRIDERPYTLPDPEILRARHDAPVRTLENKDIVGASSTEPTSLQTQVVSAEAGRGDLNVFEGRTVMISSDLNITTRLLQSIEQIIEKGKGGVAHDVRQADIYICRYREGKDYKLASRLGKEVGNLSWLFHLITHNCWTSPLRRMLHYPVARNGIPGFENFRISLSNYAGEARIYLENLISATGAECTKTLKQNNTHLITAHVNSEKCDAAKEWNLSIVNHLWLEESYAKWELKSVTNPRYSHFPPRTNLGEIVGQTKIDRPALEEHFFPPDDESSEDRLPLAVMQQKDDNNQSNVPETTALRPKPTKQPKAKTSATETPKGARGAKGANKGKEKESNLQTPMLAKFIGEGKENETPSTTGSRKSKDVATARLHDIAPDIALYEKESKRVGGVIYGGRRKSDHSDRIVPKKRSVEPEDAGDDAEANDMKKQKKKSPVKMHLLLTGYQRWVGEPKLEDSDRRALRDVGILVVQDPAKATHLAAPSILRTHKFVNAIAYSVKLIHIDFVTDCLEKEEFLNPDKYPLQDRASEKKYELSLAKALQRAKTNKNKLLEGKMIYCLESIHGGFDAFKSIVETNGGQCALFKGRSGITVPNRRASGGGSDDGQDNVYLISGAEKNHAKFWPRFRKLVQDAKGTPRIVRADWLLDIAMSQEWRWKDSFEIRDEDVVMSDD